MPGVMITNNGAHPPEKWAVMTGEHIFPLDGVTEPERLVLARRVQTAIIEALIPHHRAHMDEERHNLAAEGNGRLGTVESHDRANTALESIISCLKGSPWEEKGNDPWWRSAVKGELITHFNTVQHIEQQWHAHRNPSATGTAWLSSHNLKLGA